MDITVPLTLEAVRLAYYMGRKTFDSTPEDLYDHFYKKGEYTRICILSSGTYFFARESDLKVRQYVPVTVTVEEAREILFIRSLEN